MERATTQSADFMADSNRDRENVARSSASAAQVLPAVALSTRQVFPFILKTAINRPQKTHKRRKKTHAFHVLKRQLVLTLRVKTRRAASALQTLYFVSFAAI
jgi:hypothetical protein